MDKRTFVDAFLRWYAEVEFDKGYYGVDSPKELFNDEDWRVEAESEFLSGYPKSGSLVFVGAISTPFRVVNREGGPDQGSHIETTWYLPDSDQYYTAEGYYVSHQGYNWEDGEFYESTPAQKSTTVWVKKHG